MKQVMTWLVVIALVAYVLKNPAAAGREVRYILDGVITFFSHI